MAKTRSQKNAEKTITNIINKEQIQKVKVKLQKKDLSKSNITTATTLQIQNVIKLKNLKVNLKRLRINSTTNEPKRNEAENMPPVVVEAASTETTTERSAENISSKAINLRVRKHSQITINNKQEFSNKNVQNNNKQNKTSSTAQSATHINLSTKLSKNILKPRNIMHVDDTTIFEPSRNSTFISQKFSKSKQLIDNNESEEISNLSDKLKYKSTKNLTNNPNEIERLLLSDEINIENDDEVNNVDKIEIIKVSDNASKKTQQQNSHKFFNREKNTENNKVKKTKNIKNNQSKRKSKKTLSSKSTKKNNVYEFLSQTSESDTCNTNPADDVIQKLIAKGAVRLATRLKGAGRPKLKRIEKQKKTVKIVQKPIEMHNDIDDDAFEDYDDYSNGLSPPTKNNNITRNELIPENTFSKLARSVIVQEAQKNTKQIQEKRRLLDAAKKIYSTPIAKNVTSILNGTNLSPIIVPQKSPLSFPSPYRVTYDVYLPKVTYFGCNSKNLPSFMSSHLIDDDDENIQTRKRMTKTVSNTKTNNSSISKNISILQFQNIDTTKSNLSINDSNGENIPPVIDKSLHTDENADVFNLRQQQNPRRTLTNRSPLKAINILSDIQLTNWKKKQTKEFEKNNSKNLTASEIEQLFVVSEEEPDEINIESTQKQTINYLLTDTPRKKFEKIKRWRPEMFLKTPEKKENSCNHKLIFDNDVTLKPKQRKIKEMLCSTAINNESQQHTNLDDAISFDEVFEKKQTPVKFKEDMRCNKRRTYSNPVRIIKRKRKLRGELVLVTDSEDSSDDELNKSRKTKKINRSKENQDTHKKTKTDPQYEADLNEFVSEFNEMVDQVNNYQLVVE